MGKLPDAFKDYQLSLELDGTCVNTCLKLASVSMEQQQGKNLDAILKWFDAALAINKNDPDIYYHR